MLHKEVEVEENIIRREETQTIIQEEEVLDLHDKVTPMKTISIFNRQGNTNGKEAVFQTIKKIQSHRDGEFNSTEFVKYLENCG